eukprot:Filipodium_phascolosomae@DN1984_c0_g1_i4.p1
MMADPATDWSRRFISSLPSHFYHSSVQSAYPTSEITYLEPYTTSEITLLEPYDSIVINSNECYLQPQYVATRITREASPIRSHIIYQTPVSYRTISPAVYRSESDHVYIATSSSSNPYIDPGKAVPAFHGKAAPAYSGRCVSPVQYARRVSPCRNITPARYTTIRRTVSPVIVRELHPSDVRASSTLPGIYMPPSPTPPDVRGSPTLPFGARLLGI